jgi:hypothetical protein
MKTRPLEYSYALEKIGEAVRVLVTGHGEVRARVTGAFLPMVALKSTDLPPEFRKDWDWIYTQATKYGPAKDETGKVYRGSVANTMWHLRNSTGSKIASRIWTLYSELDHYLTSH